MKKPAPKVEPLSPSLEKKKTNGFRRGTTRNFGRNSIMSGNKKSN
jgi:hypothetical protein